MPALGGRRAAWRRAAAVTLRLAVLLIAVVALRRELAGLDRGQIADAFRHYDAWQIALAVLGTAASFATLGLVELLALRYAERGASNIPRRAAFATSCVAHAVGQSIGFGLFTGAAVRVRAYSKYDVGAEACARISIFASATPLLGLCSLGAVALLATSRSPALVWSRAATISIGAAMAALVLAYLAWCSLGSNTRVGVGRWRLTPPSPPIAAAQLSLAVVDWLVTGTVLYALVPHGTFASLAGFLATYVVAHAAGIASHIPAGAGVFEAAFLAPIAPGLVTPGRAGLVASLLAYRVLYYALPLCAAAALATMSELRRRPSGAP